MIEGVMNRILPSCGTSASSIAFVASLKAVITALPVANVSTLFAPAFLAYSQIL